MSESIIATLRFTGTAKGSFAPPEQVFVVPREFILGVVRITINGTHPGRSHETNVSLSFENDTYVNSTQLDVLDGEPTTSSFRSLLSRLVTGYNYKLGLYVSGFDHDGEEVAISVDLLELDTTLAQVTKDVLMDAEKELRINDFRHLRGDIHFTHHSAVHVSRNQSWPNSWLEHDTPHGMGRLSAMAVCRARRRRESLCDTRRPNAHIQACEWRQVS